MMAVEKAEKINVSRRGTLRVMYKSRTHARGGA